MSVAITARTTTTTIYKKYLCGFLTWWLVPTHGWHRSPTLTAADGDSMPGPAKHPSLRHPTTIRYVQPRPPSARREPPYPDLAQQSASDTDPQPDSSLTLYAPASHVLRRPEAQTKPRKAPAAISSTGSAEPALFKPTELAPTRDPINHPYTVGCALNTTLKQALSQPKQLTSSRTASDSVFSEAVPSHCRPLVTHQLQLSVPAACVPADFRSSAAAKREAVPIAAKPPFSARGRSLSAAGAASQHAAALAHQARPPCRIEGCT
eukprot:scaffold4809_cov116-Isochrysis_galbana.AAC.4